MLLYRALPILISGTAPCRPVVLQDMPEIPVTPLTAVILLTEVIPLMEVIPQMVLI